MWTRPLYRAYERRLEGRLPTDRRPGHIGVILDGHRRFARAQGLADYRASYRAGMTKFEEFVGWCNGLHIPAITAWVLSTENLTRPADELEALVEVIGELIRRLSRTAPALGYSLQVIGSLDRLPRPLAEAAKNAGRSVAGGRQLTLAVGYGGRQEIVDACRSLVSDLLETGVAPDELAERIDAESLAAHLYSPDVPDPDLIVRTSGEARLSGFLMWQSVYAEFVFVDPYWPDFRRVDFLRALRDYAGRERRFGR